jgi:UDP-N-acetylmuramoyl-tripeptide--D-alanyl-D-alanine ligase
VTLELGAGKALLIDESYNANPASMRAALALLGQAPVGRRGRRIAVLGDMLELGTEAEALHRGLLDPITDCDIDLVFCSGPLMNALWAEIPLEPQVLDAIRDGDAVMVKGSLGSRMGPIVKALTNRYTRREAPAAASA